MISEGSYDTEDWSNDAENSALITGINSIFVFRTYQNRIRVILNCYNISHHYTVSLSDSENPISQSPILPDALIS